jgi:hypothetical protein
VKSFSSHLPTDLLSLSDLVDTFIQNSAFQLVFIEIHIVEEQAMVRLKDSYRGIKLTTLGLGEAQHPSIHRILSP